MSLLLANELLVGKTISYQNLNMLILTDKQKQLKEEVNNFLLCNQLFNKLDGVEESQERSVHNDHIRKLGQYGLLGINIPEKYGGREGDGLDYALVVEDLCRVCARTAMEFNLYTNRVINAINIFGTNAQKMKYLNKLCTGELVGFTLHNFEATKIDSNSYYLSSEDKSIIYEHDLYLIYASISEGNVFQTTIFITEKLLNDNCTPNFRVTQANILGQKDQADLIETECSRLEKIGLAAGHIGIMDAAFDFANEYSQSQVVNKVELTTRMYTKLNCCRSYLYLVAQSSGCLNSKDWAALIIYCSKSLKEVFNILRTIWNADNEMQNNRIFEQLQVNYSELTSCINSESLTFLIYEKISQEYS